MKKIKHKRKVKKKMPFNYLIVGIIGLVIGTILGQSLQSGSQISSAEAQTKAESFINNLLQGRATAKIMNISESNGLYVLSVDIDGSVLNSYMTKDGKLLFPQAFKLEEVSETTTQQTEFDAPDKEKPEVSLFVMSFCPFGIQAQELMKPVVDLLGDKADIKIRFIAQTGDSIDETQSLHGINEAMEDIRQLCIMKDYPDKYWDYLMDVNKNCYPIYSDSEKLDECWKNAANTTGIDTSKVETCVNIEGLDLLKADEQLVSQYSVSGSPTIIINGKIYTGSRTSEDFKNAVCSGFISQPEECSQSLGAVSTASSAPASGCE